jgi:hypothetical protein
MFGITADATCGPMSTHTATCGNIHGDTGLEPNTWVAVCTQSSTARAIRDIPLTAGVLEEVRFGSKSECTLQHTAIISGTDHGYTECTRVKSTPASDYALTGTQQYATIVGHTEVKQYMDAWPTTPTVLDEPDFCKNNIYYVLLPDNPTREQACGGCQDCTLACIPAPVPPTPSYFDGLATAVGLVVATWAPKRRLRI